MISDVFVMLLELLSREQTTAAQLAEKMEVSVRTVYRYIDVLSAAHVPVYCKKGRGGGIMIGSEFRLPSNYFDKDELQLVTAAVEAFAQTQTSADVLRKLKALRPRAERAGYASEDFAVDFSDAPAGGAFGAKLDALTEAKKQRRAVKIKYHNRSGEVSERVIEPYIFVYNNGNWYVYAMCRRDNGMRTFKISRVTHIFPTQSHYDIPAAFERDWNLSDPTRTSKISVTLRVKEKARYDIEEWFGIENVTSTERGDYMARAELFDNDATAAKLVSFGDGIEIVRPRQLAEKVYAAHAAACEAQRLQA